MILNLIQTISINSSNNLNPKTVLKLVICILDLPFDISKFVDPNNFVACLQEFFKVNIPEQQFEIIAQKILEKKDESILIAMNAMNQISENTSSNLSQVFWQQFQIFINQNF